MKYIQVDSLFRYQPKPPSLLDVTSAQCAVERPPTSPGSVLIPGELHGFRPIFSSASRCPRAQIKRPQTKNFSQQRRTHRTAARPSFRSSCPSGFPSILAKAQKLPATHAATMMPIAKAGATTCFTPRRTGFSAEGWFLLLHWESMRSSWSWMGGHRRYKAVPLHDLRWLNMHSGETTRSTARMKMA